MWRRLLPRTLFKKFNSRCLLGHLKTLSFVEAMLLLLILVHCCTKNKMVNGLNLQRAFPVFLTIQSALHYCHSHTHQHIKIHAQISTQFGVKAQQHGTGGSWNQTYNPPDGSNYSTRWLQPEAVGKFPLMCDLCLNFMTHLEKHPGSLMSLLLHFP